MTQAVATFAQELDRLADEGRSVRVWWRDDDAVAATPALQRLLALAGSVGAPLAIAAIPAAVEPSLPERLRDAEDVAILVHGWEHADHAPRGEKRAEFGGHREGASVRADLVRALASTRATFGDRALPVFVPPWNRIATEVSAVLPEVGYRGLSTFSVGRAREPLPGCVRIDTHLDPVDWRGSRSLAAVGVLEDAFRRALAAEEPVGLLTHHLDFDERLWSFTRDLVELLARHTAARFVPVASLLSRGTGPSSARLLTGRNKARSRPRPEYAL